MNTVLDLKFGRYVALKLLGEGAMGKVYLAEDPVLQRKLAIKVISIDENLNTGSRQEYLTRFTLEARSSAQLKHPSIVAVHDAGEEDGVPWIAFEYVEGDGLDVLLQRERPMSVSKAITTIRDIADALGHAHGTGIVHRDIKPANILIDSATGTAKLTDFGIAKAPWTSLTQEGNMVGSPGYMSPEQIDGRPIDARSDIFSLGVVLYEALTGKHPFLRETVAATVFATMSESFEPVRTLRPEVSQQISDLVSRCLLVDREKRISSAQELIESLEKEMSGNDHTENAIRIPFPKETLKSLTEEIPVLASAAGRGTSTFVRKFFALLLPLLAWLNQRISVLVKSLAKKVSLHICALAKQIFWSSPVRARQTVVGGIALIASLSAVLIASAGFESIRFKRELRKVGFTGSVRAAIQESLAKLDSDKPAEAKDIAEVLTQFPKTEAIGRVILGRIEVREEDYRDASEQFARAITAPGGKGRLRKQREGILYDLGQVLSRREAHQEMVTLVVDNLKLGRHPAIREWVEHDDYWLRWNAVRILEAAGIKIDMVKVYIRDLQTSKSMSVRYRAVQRLGDLGDRRAIPPLEKAAAKGFNDPVVSAAARDVLDRKLK